MEREKVEEAIAARKIRLILGTVRNGLSAEGLKRQNERFEKMLGERFPERLENILKARENVINRLSPEEQATIRDFYGTKTDI